MIICPNNGDECSKTIIPLKKSAFLIISYPEEENPEINQIEQRITGTFDQKKFKVILAKDIRQGRNLFCKICKNIRSVPVGVIVYTDSTPAKSFPNIFYELGLIMSFGKEPILIKDKKTKIPSDLQGLEWIEFGTLEDLSDGLSRQIDELKITSNYYLGLGKQSKDKQDFEKAIDYFKRAYLLDPNEEVLTILQNISRKLNETREKTEYHGLTMRLIDDLENFLKSIE